MLEFETSRLESNSKTTSRIRDCSWKPPSPFDGEIETPGFVGSRILFQAAVKPWIDLRLFIAVDHSSCDGGGSKTTRWSCSLHLPYIPRQLLHFSNYILGEFTIPFWKKSTCLLNHAFTRVLHLDQIYSHTEYIEVYLHQQDMRMNHPFDHTKNRNLGPARFLIWSRY